MIARDRDVWSFSAYWAYCRLTSKLGKIMQSKSEQGKERYRSGFLHQMLKVYGLSHANAHAELEAWEDMIDESEWEEMTFSSGIDDAKESASYWGE